VSQQTTGFSGDVKYCAAHAAHSFYYFLKQPNYLVQFRVLKAVKRFGTFIKLLYAGVGSWWLIRGWDAIVIANNAWETGSPTNLACEDPMIEENLKQRNLLNGSRRRTSERARFYLFAAIVLVVICIVSTFMVPRSHPERKNSDKRSKRGLPGITEGKTIGSVILVSFRCQSLSSTL
jgi:hypothetical protein